MGGFTPRRRLAASSEALKKIAVAVVVFNVALCGITQVHARALMPNSALEAHLSRLNKPAVKTIQSEDGDIVDCVDIYKQPAFDHPLLKNHTIQMRPSFLPPKMEEKTTTLPAFHQTWQKSGSCPDGTVPIRRVQMSELRRAVSLESFGRHDANAPSQDQAGAILDHGGPYYGAEAEINVWEISVQEPNEWSRSAMEISDKTKNYIEAGVLVNPSLFGDSKTRLYIYWTADGYAGALGCYDVLCSGFFQVSETFAPGLAIERLSKFEGEQFVSSFVVRKDAISLNWWLTFQGEPVGYWPDTIFDDFQNASQVKWIGSVLNTWPGGDHTDTDMGSGQHPGGFGQAAFFKNARVLDDTDNFVPPPDPRLLVTAADCYSAVWGESGNPEVLVYYGGPGGPSCA